MTENIRWKQRFDNFENAFILLKEAFSAKIIPDGQIWIDMFEKRNLMSHTYDRETFDDVIQNISRRYFAVLEQVFTWLKQKTLE